MGMDMYILFQKKKDGNTFNKFMTYIQYFKNKTEKN